MLTRQQALELLLLRPVKYARLLGFTKLIDLHEQWITSMVSGKTDETLMAHRGSYKTTCVSIALSIIIITKPRIKTAFMRKTDDDVKEIIRQVTKILNNPVTIYLVYCIYGANLKLTERSTDKISTNLAGDIKGTSQLTGIGTGGSLTGKHFDLIFTDDIINVKDRVSAAERERIKVIYQELQNIKNRGGRIYNTLTPWHKEDASILMPNPHKWDCYSTGLIADEELEDIRAHMIPSLFACNYELEHIAAEDVIFKDPNIGAEMRLAFNGYMQIDCAYDGADYTAMTIIKKTGDKWYVFGKMWRKHCQDCENDIYKYYQQFLCASCYNEKNPDKGMYAQKLRARGMHVIGYHEDQNKFIKISSYLYDEWQNVYFVNGTDDEYIEQICSYTAEADHDDAPDSLASAIRVKWNKKSEYIPIWNNYK